MKNNVFKYINRSAKIALILLIAFLVASSTTVLETKVVNKNENKTVNLSTMAMKIIETENNVLYAAKDTYTGDLTGYSHDCPLCNGTLACKASYNIKDGTDT